MKESRQLGPPHSTVLIRLAGTTDQTCGDSKVTEKWISGNYAVGDKFRDKIRGVQKTLHSWWKKNVA